MHRWAWGSRAIQRSPSARADRMTFGYGRRLASRLLICWVPLLVVSGCDVEVGGVSVGAVGGRGGRFPTLSPVMRGGGRETCPLCPHQPDSSEPSVAVDLRRGDAADLVDAVVKLAGTEPLRSGI